MSDQEISKVSSDVSHKWTIEHLDNLLANAKVGILEAFKSYLRTKTPLSAFGYDRVHFSWDDLGDGSAVGTAYVGFTKIFRGLFTEDASSVEDIYVFLPKERLFAITQTKRNVSYTYFDEQEGYCLIRSSQMNRGFELWTRVSFEGPKACFLRRLGPNGNTIELNIDDFSYFHRDDDGSLSLAAVHQLYYGPRGISSELTDEQKESHPVLVELNQYDATPPRRFIYQPDYPNCCIRIHEPHGGVDTGFASLVKDCAVKTWSGSNKSNEFVFMDGVLLGDSPPKAPDNVAPGTSSIAEINDYLLSLEEVSREFVDFYRPVGFSSFDGKTIFGDPSSSETFWTLESDEEGELVLSDHGKHTRFEVQLSPHFEVKEFYLPKNPLAVSAFCERTRSVRTCKSWYYRIYPLRIRGVDFGSRGRFALWEHSQTKRKFLVDSHCLGKTSVVYPIPFDDLNLSSEDMISGVEIPGVETQDTITLSLSRDGGRVYDLLKLDKTNPNHLVGDRKMESIGKLYPDVYSWREVWVNDEGLLHNLNGPAFRGSDNGREEWWRDGIRHRNGGPALTTDHREEWWYNGLFYPSAEDFYDSTVVVPLNQKFSQLREALHSETKEILKVFREVQLRPDKRDAFGYEDVRFVCGSVEFNAGERGYSVECSAFVGDNKVFAGTFRTTDSGEFLHLKDTSHYLPKSGKLHIMTTRMNNRSYRLLSEDGNILNNIELVQYKGRTVFDLELWTEVGADNRPKSCYIRDVRQSLDCGMQLNIKDNDFSHFNIQDDGSLELARGVICYLDKSGSIAVALTRRVVEPSSTGFWFVYRPRYTNSCIRFDGGLTHEYHNHFFSETTVTTRDGAVEQHVRFKENGEIDWISDPQFETAIPIQKIPKKDSSLAVFSDFQKLLTKTLERVVNLNEPLDFRPIQGTSLFGHPNLQWEIKNDHIVATSNGKVVISLYRTHRQYVIHKFDRSKEVPVRIENFSTQGWTSITVFNTENPAAFVSEKPVVFIKKVYVGWKKSVSYRMKFGCDFSILTREDPTDSSSKQEYVLRDESESKFYSIPFKQLDPEWSLDFKTELEGIEGKDFYMFRKPSQSWYVIQKGVPGYLGRFDGDVVPENLPKTYDQLARLLDCEVWTKNGKLHNPDGPALCDKDKQEWFMYGERHRPDGPAVVYALNPEKNEWWYQGFKYPSEDDLKSSLETSAEALKELEEEAILSHESFLAEVLENRGSDAQEIRVSTEELKDPNPKILPDKDDVLDARMDPVQVHDTTQKDMLRSSGQPALSKLYAQELEGEKELKALSQLWFSDPTEKEEIIGGISVTTTIDQDCVKHVSKYETSWKLKDGTLHRSNGPALILSDVEKWYLNGQLHREGGPAIVWSNGCCEWYMNDIRHRADGPAFYDSLRKKYPTKWWLAGKEVSEEEHQKLRNVIRPDHNWKDHPLEKMLAELCITQGIAENIPRVDFEIEGSPKIPYDQINGVISNLPRIVLFQLLDSLVAEIVRTKFQSGRAGVVDLAKLVAPIIVFHVSENPSLRASCEEYLRLSMVKYGLQGLQTIKTALFTPESVRVIERFADLSVLEGPESENPREADKIFVTGEEISKDLLPV